MVACELSCMLTKGSNSKFLSLEIEPSNHLGLRVSFRVEALISRVSMLSSL